MARTKELRGLGGQDVAARVGAMIMSASSQSSPLSVKCIAGGGGLGVKTWADAISNIERSLMSLREFEVTPFRLTVTFVIPGETYAPKFKGVRVNSYLEEYETLVIQVALPESPPADGPRAEVVRYLSLAVDKAEAWGKKKNLTTGPLSAIRSAFAGIV